MRERGREREGERERERERGREREREREREGEREGERERERESEGRERRGGAVLSLTDYACNIYVNTLYIYTHGAFYILSLS